MKTKSTKPKEQGMTVTTMSLPDELYRRIKIRALDERRPLVEVVREALSDYLFRHEPGKLQRVKFIPPKADKE
jgi:hypothetical protein